MTDEQPRGHDLTQVLSRFPADGALIRRLLLESESFRSVCEDLADASKILAELRQSPPSEKVAERIRDYEELVADLEQEIEKELEKARPPR
jgi:hypothetical protein